MFFHSTLIVTALLFGAACTSPLIIAQQNEAPVITVNSPDPSIIKGPDGIWHIFTTNNGGQNVPTASSACLGGPYTFGADALPNGPSWAAAGNVWAPSVIQVADGTFVLYYAVTDAASPNQHCVGTATGPNVEGPFTPQSTALACNISIGRAIDPAGFRDSDGTYYVVYKVDGNSIGHGGSCGNTVAPIVPTPIMLQKMAADGITINGAPVEILDRGDADGPLIEAPSLMRTSCGTYILFFSSNCYSTTLYDISYATATNVAGPYTKSSAPLLVTGDYGLTAPGGATVLQDGTAIVFHANCVAGRCMFERSITINGTIVTT